MSDFDPKSIPVLDDIIEEDGINANEPDNTENENNLDLFEDNEAESTTEIETPIDTADNHVDINDVNEKINQLTVQYEYEEIYSGLAFRLDGTVKKEEQAENKAQNRTNPLTTMEPLVLEPIVESVVKQMMPDLEQQLRFLIQQALEKKLPQEILKSSDTETDDNATTRD